MKAKLIIRAHPSAIARSRYCRALLFFVLGFVPLPAFAYLDPGTGSMLLQGLIALIGGIVSTVALYWRTVVEFIRSRLSDKRKHHSSETDKQ